MVKSGADMTAALNAIRRSAQRRMLPVSDETDGEIPGNVVSHLLSHGVRAGWVLWLACLVNMASQANEPLDPSPCRADRILVKPKQGVSLEKIRQLHARNQCEVIGQFSERSAPDGLLARGSEINAR